MERSYYNARVSDFIEETPHSILGKLTENHPFALEDLQRNSWIAEINILKRELREFEEGHIIFEYTIPRVGSRIDIVLIHQGIVFLIECKIGETQFPRHAINQVTDYALDLQDFHEESHRTLLVPILMASRASSHEFSSTYLKSNITNVQCCNEKTLHQVIMESLASFPHGNVSPTSWMNSCYKPTPTIIEAAQALYRNHSVENISRNDASAYNLTRTTQAIDEIIESTKCKREKAICFITGVPGAGKTLAGLNIAIDRQRIDANEHAVFLSGNGPLVAVLQEALARDQQQHSSTKKTEATRKAKEFIQIIHHFRDDAIATTKAPIEKVAIFDEAQRAWTLPMLESFMRRKKGKTSFAMSEPEFLISVMDRHDDWQSLFA
ncbi:MULTISPECIES: DNA/RNA helicase domain-containing protein [unclassified Desulfovibrio]|uniref:DNA/RNA helicase domain-containing protein n=1 Tax=unclassified Desulfovibrio TaxID=2593640 RepID=UPI001C8A0CBE|nr:MULTISPECIES: DNA/RNA helicase domain-containing protein [unclassified Desulfovibrio]